MLRIIVPKGENYIEEINRFDILNEDVPILLEHSLVSISKWEMKYQKCFLKTKVKSQEEMLDYIRFMTIQCSNSNAYRFLTEQNLIEIKQYINNPMSATEIPEILGEKKSKSDDAPTNEIIYYTMIELHIPIEFENWHLNRLIKLINVFNYKNGDHKIDQRAAAEARLNISKKRRAEIKARKEAQKAKQKM